MVSVLAQKRSGKAIKHNQRIKASKNVTKHCPNNNSEILKELLNMLLLHCSHMLMPLSFVSKGTLGKEPNAAASAAAQFVLFSIYLP